MKEEEVLLPFGTASNNNNNQNSTKVENNNQITLILWENSCRILITQTVCLSLCFAVLIVIIAVRKDVVSIVISAAIVFSLLFFWCFLNLRTAKTLNLIKNECTN